VEIKTKVGDFLFASSNPLWRASLDTIDFMGLSNVDYAGGLIITDWYSENSPNESIKFTLRFVSNEIRVDAINIDIRKKICEETNECVIKKVDNQEISNLLKDKILKKAANYKSNIENEVINNRPKKIWGVDE
jgi:hypothetical protein